VMIMMVNLSLYALQFCSLLLLFFLTTPSRTCERVGCTSEQLIACTCMCVHVCYVCMCVYMRVRV
jgi:hypothetical protein